MKITKVDEANIADAGRIHSESWKQSHRSFWIMLSGIALEHPACGF